MYRFQYGQFLSDITTINSWTETLETTDDDADRWCVRIEGRLSAIWSPWTQGSGLGVTGEMTAAEKKAILGTILAEKRQQLLFGIPDHSQPTQNGQPSFNMVIISPLFQPLPAGANPNTPRVPYACDAKNGPLIEVQSIAEAMGEVTMVVEFKFTTWVQATNTMRAVVSNRWTQTEELDPCFWSRIITQGVSYFRADAMRVPRPGGTFTLMSPDQFSQAVMPPVPNGYQRRAVRREVSSDGLQLIWSTVDEQCALMPVNRKIARIHGYFSDQYSPATVNDVITGAMTGAEWGGIASGGDPIIAAGGFLAGGLAGAFPAQTITLYLRVDGRPDATRSDLIDALSRIATGLSVAGGNLLQRLARAIIYTDSLTQGLDDDSIWAEVFIQCRGSVVQSGALAMFGLSPGSSRIPLINNANPDLNGLGIIAGQPNAGMVALVPNPAGLPRGSAGSGTPPSDDDPTRNPTRTAFLRSADVKDSEGRAKAITSTSSQRTNVAPGDVKQDLG